MKQINVNLEIKQCFFAIQSSKWASLDFYIRIHCVSFYCELQMKMNQALAISIAIWASLSECSSLISCYNLNSNNIIYTCMYSIFGVLSFHTVFTSSTSMIAHLPIEHYIILLFSFFDKLSLTSLLSVHVPYAFSDINEQFFYQNNVPIWQVNAHQFC